MAHAHPGETKRIKIVTLTISDTRTSADDKSGDTLRAKLNEHGFDVARHEIIRDEPEQVRASIMRAIEVDKADAVISTGGTGIAPRDRTYEAVSGLLEKTLDGFGEAFRRLSWAEIGPRSILSRAIAGTYSGAIVIALPGSTNAVALGIDQLVAPVLGHAVTLVKG